MQVLHQREMKRQTCTSSFTKMLDGKENLGYILLLTRGMLSAQLLVAFNSGIKSQIGCVREGWPDINPVLHSCDNFSQANP